ncbi:hypothetical protein SKAU_G00180190 [Synaphobranchus kaupii]|uniref:Cystatin domain-containing protein n=1 Tax=Synaphobranchus kaupii TaxID=118154 RepID=A0A9Q1FMT0_SYNKA|nr:hypothetical protein SKAU_G00180190 [Synaphobranchus kaupii]
MVSSVWLAVLAVFLEAAGLTVCVPVMTGGPMDVPSNRSDVLRAARFAVYEYNEEISEEYAYKTTSIASSQVQVVAGLRFILDVNLGLTECKKMQASDVENCSLQRNGKELHCHFVVLDVPWENIKRLTERRCTADEQQAKNSAGEPPNSADVSGWRPATPVSFVLRCCTVPRPPRGTPLFWGDGGIMGLRLASHAGLYSHAGHTPYPRPALR